MTDTTRQTHLLVVDDSEMNRDMLTRRLCRRGYRVTAAHDGHEALEQIEKHRFDAVLLDITMPRLDGLDVLEILRKTYSTTDLPIVMATALDRSEDVVKALKLGANDYVTKPLDFAVVLARVETQVSIKRAVDRIVELERDLHRRNQDLEQANARITKDHQLIKQQKTEVDRLLDNALTHPVARVLRQTGSYPPTRDDLCVVACDIVGFSQICKTHPVKAVVEEINRFYNKYDSCCLPRGVEPLRSQGDSRIALAGLNSDPSLGKDAAVIDAILAMLAFRAALAPMDPPPSYVRPDDALMWSARIGIDVGPVMMGVLSGTRLCFDVWGDPVNMAARLEQSAAPNQIVVSDRVLAAARGLFDHGPVRELKIKDTLVRGAVIHDIRNPFQDGQGQPNDAFWKTYSQRDHPPTHIDHSGTIEQAPPITIERRCIS